MNQILSRCFLSAMAMASEREEAPSLEKIVCRWALTPSGPTSNSRWAHYEAGERIPTDIHGLTVKDVEVGRAERLLNLQGAAERPVRDVRILKVRAASVVNPDVIENVEML